MAAGTGSTGLAGQPGSGTQEQDWDDGATDDVGGSFRLVVPRGGPQVGHVEVQRFSRVADGRPDVHRLDALYGIIRAQALTPSESLAFVEKVLGGT